MNSNAEAALREAATEFCRRVEAGEIRSKRSYAAFKAALSAPAADGEALAERPWSYAYRYGDGVLRLNGGEEVNGGKPIEAIGVYLAPDAGRGGGVRREHSFSDAVLREALVNGDHYLGAVLSRLERLYEEHPNDPRLREQISDEIPWLEELRKALSASGSPGDVGQNSSDADHTPHKFEDAGRDTCRKCGNRALHPVHAPSDPAAPQGQDAAAGRRPDSIYSQFHLDNWADEDFARHTEATRKTLRYLLELEARTRAPEATEAWCQPMDCGKHTPRTFIVRFEDRDKGDSIFHDEAEARRFFENATLNWNCYLFGTLPLVAQPAKPVSVETIARKLFDIDALPHFTWEEVGTDRREKYTCMALAIHALIYGGGDGR